MSPTEFPEEGPLPLSLDRVVDQVCDRFEDDWKAGRQPRIEQYLGEVPPPARPALLCELLRVELAYRRGRGEQPALEEYRPRFPEHPDLINQLFERAPLTGAAPSQTQDYQAPAARPRDAPAPVRPRAPRPGASGSPRFEPGQVLAGRYRIVAIL